MVSSEPLFQSEKPYEGENVKSLREHYPTYAEWVSQGNREQIKIVGAGIAAGSNLIYSIPENKILFITGLILSGRDTAGAGRDYQVFFQYPTTAGSALAFIHVPANGSSSTSLNFSMPYRVNGSRIYLNQASANSASHVVIYGFLEDINI